MGDTRHVGPHTSCPESLEDNYLEDGTGGKQMLYVRVNDVILITTVKIKAPPLA